VVPTLLSATDIIEDKNVEKEIKQEFILVYWFSKYLDACM